MPKIPGNRVPKRPLEPREQRIYDAAEKLSGFAAACKQENTDDWMYLFADKINRTLEVLGDADRVYFDVEDGVLYKCSVITMRDE